MHLYVAKNRLGKFGYIDTTGEPKLPCVYEDAGGFSEGFASVTLNGEKFVINIDGEPQYQHDFAELGPFRDGLAPFRKDDADQRKFGFVSPTGELVIDCMFDGVLGFYAGRCAVQQHRKWGFIDKSGRYVTQPQFDYCHSFFPGEVTSSFLRDRLWGLISREGEVIIEPRWAQAHRFSEGVVPVKIGGKWGLADRCGEIILEPKFTDSNYYLSEGRVGVYDGKAWMFIGAAGHKLSDHVFTYVEPYREGLARVCVGGRYVENSDEPLIDVNWGFVDRSGEIVIKPVFDYCSDFDGPLAEVWIGNVADPSFLFAYINHRGTYVWRQGDF